MNIPSDVITKEIARWGDTITIQVVTDSSYSDYGDATELTSNSSITAVVNELSGDDELVKQGIFNSGDKTFFCKNSDSGLVNGNRIIHDSKKYEISEVLKHSLNNTNYVYEVRAKKI